MSEFDRLRHLLLSEESGKRVLAEQRIDELERINSELAALLPGLVTAAPSEPMSRALATPVAAALGNAVHRNRASIVDALFPVIGPIIRKAIAEALRNLMRDLNQVLEHGFSPRGIRWRLEAWRSGVPFAQIVLKHSLRYRLDHVFLIERDSGLVLHRESSPGLPDLDSDAIAGMLTAIGQFVRDSVGRDGGDSLEAARVGEHLLWVLDGPRASLACFIQGVPPDSLRVVLSDRLEQIHAQLSETREVTAGDVSPAESELGTSLDPVDLVAASAALADDDGSERARPSRWPILLIVLLILCALGWHFVHVARWNERVDELRSGLAAHPGFLLTGIESKPWNRLTVHGLIDADAEPLQSLLGKMDFGEIRPVIDLEGYLSTDDAILLRRATRLLDPPAGVQLAVANGVLAVSGQAARDWIEKRHEQAAWVAGIRSVDWQVGETSDAADAAKAAAAAAATRAELTAVAAELESHVVRFDNETAPAEGVEVQLRDISDSLHRATSLAAQAGVGLRLRIDGYSDASGSAELNAGLRLARAGWLRDRLREHGVAADLLDNSTVFTKTDSSAGIRGAKVRLETGELFR
jgi:outer membrane protein OmpA-like peptidoglycan-associated protein